VTIHSRGVNDHPTITSSSLPPATVLEPFCTTGPEDGTAAGLCRHTRWTSQGSLTGHDGPSAFFPVAAVGDAIQVQCAHRMISRAPRRRHGSTEKLLLMDASGARDRPLRWIPLAAEGQCSDRLGFAHVWVCRLCFLLLVTLAAGTRLDARGIASSAITSEIRSRAMRLLPTQLDGPLLIEPTVHGDARGFFLEAYRRSTFAALAPLDIARRSLMRSAARSLATTDPAHQRQRPANASSQAFATPRPWCPADRSACEIGYRGACRVLGRTVLDPPPGSQAGSHRPADGGSAGWCPA